MPQFLHTVCGYPSNPGHNVEVLLRSGSGRGARYVFDLRQKPRRFGVDDNPRCPLCGELSSLTRRGPDADYDLQHERQMFTCFRCDLVIERVVDADG